MPAQPPVLERKGRDAAAVAAAAETLRGALRAAGRTVATPATATALTGLPLDVSRDALFRLAATYPAHVVVAEDGTPGFAFDALDRPRQGPLARAGAACRAWWHRHGDVVVAACTLVALPALLWSVTGNLGALVEALPAARAPGGPLAGPLGGLVFFLLVPTLVLSMAAAGLAMLGLAVPFAALWGLATGVADLARGGGDPVGAFAVGGVAAAITGGFAYAFVLGQERAWARELWAAGGGLLFGPPPADALDDERRLVALIARLGGVLALADVVALFGWTAAGAEGAIARVLADYGGEVVVTGEGAILYLFDPLRLAATDAAAADVRPAAERERAYPPFLGAPWWLAAFAALAGALGLLGLALHPALQVFPTPASWLALEGARDIRLVQGLGAWIHLACALPLALRLPAWLRGRRAWPARRRFLDLVAAATATPADVPAAGHAMADVVALGGEVVGGPDGAPRLAFPAFARAARAAARLRGTAEAADFG